MKHIVCFSGGHSSALVAYEVVRKYGHKDVILLNHDINSSKELLDVKRFKKEVSAYLGIPITYCNYQGIEDNRKLPNQFDVVKQVGFIKKPRTGSAICTHYLKTKPFENWLFANYPLTDTLFFKTSPITIYYGFDKSEENRILRRSSILAAMGYKTCFPLAHWERTIQSTEEIGIVPPQQYDHYKHANCIGCLKGGIQHWYVTYCHYPEVFAEAKTMENDLGYSILKRWGRACFLEELESTFEYMKLEGIEASEHLPRKDFRQALKKYDSGEFEEVEKPCECMF